MRKVYVWNHWNVAHIARHGVEPDEAEHVVDHASRPYPQRVGDRKYLVRGRTHHARLLQVIYIRLGDDEVDIELLSVVERAMFEAGNEVVYVIHSNDFRPRGRRRKKKR